MSEQIEMWKPEEGEISVAAMDEAIVVLRQLDNEKKATKKVAEEASAKYTEQQRKVMAMMEEAGKEEYIVTGFGKVSLKEMTSVRTPKSPDEKKAFFDWIKGHLGEDAYYHYMSVNSASLNALYKEQLEEFGERGEVLEIDGISAPTSYTKMSFTKA